MTDLDHSECVPFVCRRNDPKNCPLIVMEQKKIADLDPHERDVERYADDEFRNGDYNSGLDVGYDIGYAAALEKVRSETTVPAASLMSWLIGARSSGKLAPTWDLFITEQVDALMASINVTSQTIEKIEEHYSR